jgi:hypothetical protein
VAQAVGKLLVNAFHDLGPPITRFIKEYGPTFANAVEHIAGFIKDKVIPALGILIDWLTNNKQGIKDFFIGFGEAAAFAGQGRTWHLRRDRPRAWAWCFPCSACYPGVPGRAFGAAATSSFAARDAAIKLAAGIDTGPAQERRGHPARR